MVGLIPLSLEALFSAYPGPITGSPRDCQVGITGVVYDSRQVQPGCVFVALQGINVDGHKYIADAVQRGAAAVVGTRPDVSAGGVPYIRVADARQVLAYLAAAFYRFPARRMTMTGVTGTDGKTTTSNLIYKILQCSGKRVGMVSTVNAQIGDEAIDTGYHVTTPEAPEVQRLLWRMAAAGMTHVVLEATSHGLAQHRVAACEFDVGVVTNITHEHLDYHGSYEAYWEAKGRLFAGLAGTGFKPRGNPRLAVLNRDDRSYEYLDQITTVRKVTYSLLQDADITANNVRHGPDGLHFDVAVGRERFPVCSPLIGLHNVANCLAAVGVAYFGHGADPEAIQRGIRALQGIPGRMELIDRGQPFIAIVDFAHTPNALVSALKTARELTHGRVLAVFGSAGLRDREKRRMMAEISADLADKTFLTAEDPRTESLSEILAEMAGAMREKGGVEDRTYVRVPDRGQAILRAVQEAQPGDVVISCGKGHEQSMCFDEIEYPWDDRVAVEAALAISLGQEGPAMPYLPTQD